jgi:hypothetical protein
MTRRHALAVVALAAVVLTACGSGPGTTEPEGVDGLEIPTPSPDPRDFVDRIDNPYLPLLPGSTWTYEVTGEGGDETVTVTVTDETRVVEGVTTTVVHDRVTDPDGEIVEDTFDWYAQDVDGNVWYFGEHTTAYAGDQTSTEGSWEAGIDGARAGVVMLARPRVGDGYQQEFLEGEAEDQAEVLAIDAEVVIDEETYDDVVKTADATRLEPGLVEHKYYAPGVGLIAEETVSGGDERVVLVDRTTR